MTAERKEKLARFADDKIKQLIRLRSSLVPKTGRYGQMSGEISAWKDAFELAKGEPYREQAKEGEK